MISGINSQTREINSEFWNKLATREINGVSKILTCFKIKSSPICFSFLIFPGFLFLSFLLYYVLLTKIQNTIHKLQSVNYKLENKIGKYTLEKYTRDKDLTFYCQIYPAFFSFHFILLFGYLIYDRFVSLTPICIFLE